MIIQYDTRAKDIKVLSPKLNNFIQKRKTKTNIYFRTQKDTKKCQIKNTHVRTRIGLYARRCVREIY